MIEHDWEKIGSDVFKHSANLMFCLLSLKFGGKSKKMVEFKLGTLIFRMYGQGLSLCCSRPYFQLVGILRGAQRPFEQSLRKQ